MSDFFTVFGLPRRLAIDAAALQRRFYELSRQRHPDFHQARRPRTRRRGRWSESAPRQRAPTARCATRSPASST